MKFHDFYRTLGIVSTATDADIKRAFRGLAKKYHPDLNPGNKEAEAIFKQAGQAYEVLGDKKKRAEFDVIYSQRPQVGWGRCPDKKQGFFNLGFSQDEAIAQVCEALHTVQDFLWSAFETLGSTDLGEVAATILAYIEQQTRAVCEMGGRTYSIRFIRVALALSMGAEVIVSERDSAGRVSKITISTAVLRGLPA